MTWLVGGILYILSLACFVWAWKRFHDLFDRTGESYDDYLPGDEDPTMGDKP